MSKGKKVQVPGRAREKLGWEDGEVLAVMLNDDEDALVLMRERDVSVEKRGKEKQGE